VKQPPPRVIAYIDGFNLYFGMRGLHWSRYYWLNLPLMAANLLKPGQRLVQTKYFTTRVSGSPKDPDKPKRQNTYLEAIQTLPNVGIFYGHYLSREVTCLRCGARWTTHDEKMTDVNIATELLTDATDDRFDVALLVTADSDLTRPIQIVRERFPAKKVVMAFPPDRNSERLKQVASGYMHIGRDVLRASQLPDQVRKPDGFVLHRPIEWR